MDTSENGSMTSTATASSTTGDTSKSNLPAWRMPISTSFSNSLRDRLVSAKSSSPERFGGVGGNGGENINQICGYDRRPSSGSTGGFDQDRSSPYTSRRPENADHHENNQYQNNENNSNNNMNTTASLSNEDRPAVSRKNSGNPGTDDEKDSQAVIQILLPCLICNRTFSPEALERHAKVCTKVNIKSPYKPTRGTFDISEQRKKGTKLEDFIPPPTTDALTDNRFGFSRGSRSRTSLRGTSCTTRSTLTSPAPPTPATPQPRRRERSVSQSRDRSLSTSRTAPHLAPPPPPSSSANSQNEYPYDDTSEFGSNNSEELNQQNLPSYAKPIAPTDLCPYCNRSFGIKSFDRHVEFCKVVYERKRYEIQPVPKEKEEALERQDIRTKYRPMKGSSSCSSLRSMSPGKDFASMAMKLFGGLRRTEGSSNLYFNQIKNNLKKSNESIANSCYGDYTRGLRRPSPSPARPTVTQSATNKLNNLLTKSFYSQNQQHHPQQQFSQYGSPVHPQHQQHHQSFLPMRINTSSNIPKMTKSTDSLVSSGNNFAHVPSSGYGQPPSVLMSNNFSRNSRSRSSLHKNFFRTKRADPDGTDNTSGMSQSPTGTSPLIITPVNFYAKGNKSSSSALDLSMADNYHLQRSKTGASVMDHMMMENSRSRGIGTPLLGSDPDYDPYEKAAKQLEELLKSTPVKSSKRTSRRTGLEKAFESVGVPSDMPDFGKSKLGRTQSLDYNANAFGRSATSIGFGMRRTRPENKFGMESFGLGNGSSSSGPGVPMMMTPNIDDSYWDQILRKGDTGNQHGNNSNDTNNNSQETASSQEESDTTSGASDTAKSRAMSNTSSADSAFSRYDSLFNANTSFSYVSF